MDSGKLSRHLHPGLYIKRWRAELGKKVPEPRMGPGLTQVSLETTVFSVRLAWDLKWRNTRGKPTPLKSLMGEDAMDLFTKVLGWVIGVGVGDEGWVMDDREWGWKEVIDYSSLSPLLQSIFWFPTVSHFLLILTWMPAQGPPRQILFSHLVSS